MSFVTPIFALLGTLLIAAPIAIHLLNRRKFDRVKWAAMTWLLAASQQNRKRMRFESWLLLALRSLVVLLIGVALSRPLGCGSNKTLAALASQQPGLTVIILDDSFSMSYRGAYSDEQVAGLTNFERAKQDAVRMISNLARQDQQVAIIGASSPARTVFPTGFDKDAAIEVIRNLPQRYTATDVPAAIRIAQQVASASDVSRPMRRVHLLSDATTESLTTGSAVDLAQAARSLGEVANIVYRSFASDRPWNAAIVSVSSGGDADSEGGESSQILPDGGVIRRSAGGGIRADSNTELRAKIIGFGSPPEMPAAAQLQWLLDESPLATSSSTALTPDVSSVVAPDPKFPVGGLHVVSARLTGDVRLTSASPLPGDDVRRAVVDVASGYRVLVVEGRRGLGPLSGSGSFLRLALAPRSTAGGRSAAGTEDVGDTIVPEVISDLELSTKPLAPYRTIILAGVGSVTPEIATSLKAFVEGGGGLITFMGEPVAQASYNDILFKAGLLPGPLVARVEAQVSESQASESQATSLEQPDQTSPGETRGFTFDFNSRQPHPILSAFRDSQRSGLDTAQTFTYWRIEPGQAQVVLRFTSVTPGQMGDPAILLHSLGNGRIITVATSGDAEWTALVAKTGAYVALIHELLSASTGGGVSWLNLSCGQSLTLPSGLALAGTPQLFDASRRLIALDRDASSESAPTWRSAPLFEPGVYSLEAGATRWPVAVNIPAREADVRTLSDAEIREKFGDITIDIRRGSFDENAPNSDAAIDAANDENSDSSSGILADPRSFDFGWVLMLALLILAASEVLLAHRFGGTKSPRLSVLKKGRA